MEFFSQPATTEDAEMLDFASYLANTQDVQFHNLWGAMSDTPPQLPSGEAMSEVLPSTTFLAELARGEQPYVPPVDVLLNFNVPQPAPGATQQQQLQQQQQQQQAMGKGSLLGGSGGDTVMNEVSPGFADFGVPVSPALSPVSPSNYSGGSAGSSPATGSIGLSGTGTGTGAPPQSYFTANGGGGAGSPSTGLNGGGVAPSALGSVPLVAVQPGGDSEVPSMSDTAMDSPTTGRANNSSPVSPTTGSNSTGSRAGNGKKATDESKAAAGGRKTKVKTARRAEQNRQASRNYRLRKKQRVTELEATVAEQEEEIRALKADKIDAASMRFKMEAMEREIEELRLRLESEEKEKKEKELLNELKHGVANEVDEAVLQQTLSELHVTQQQRRIREVSEGEVFEQLNFSVCPSKDDSTCGPTPPAAPSRRVDPRLLAWESEDLTTQQQLRIHEIRSNHERQMEAILNARYELKQQLRHNLCSNICKYKDLRDSPDKLKAVPEFIEIGKQLRLLKNNIQEEAYLMDSSVSQFQALLTPKQEALWQIRIEACKNCRLSVWRSMWEIGNSAMTA